MKAYQIISANGPEGLKVVDLPEPKPSAKQVLVRVRATSLNFRDHMVVTGNYGPGIQLPLVPLSDGTGEVVAVGDEVTRWTPGDRVAGTFFQGWQSGSFTRETGATALGGALGGMLSEYVVLNEGGVVRIPDHLGFAEAATLPCAALTAWQALVVRGQVHAGQTVLLLGTGGVSIFGLQIAKMHGARVIITSSSDEKLERAKTLGADEGVNYRKCPDWEKEVHRLTDGAGVDHVLEVGGADTFPKALRSLALHGTVSVIGGVSGFSMKAPIIDMIGKMARVQGIFVGSRAMFEEMNRALALNRILPVVDRVFPFAEAPEAYRYLERGAHFGKIVISVD